MAIRTAIDATRNWSGALNRLGFGFILVVMLGKYGGLFVLNSGLKLEIQTLDIIVIASGVFIVFLSMVLGSVIISFGSIIVSSIGGKVKFDMDSRAIRAYRVGNTGNHLLVEMLRDGNNKYDQAAGFFGLFAISILLLLFSAIFGELGPISAVSAVEIPAPSIFSNAIYGGLGSIFGVAVGSSAKNTIASLDKVLDLNYPEIENSDGAPATQGE